MFKKKKLIYILALFVLLASYYAFSTYQKIYSPNTQKDGFVFISTNSSFAEAVTQLTPFLVDVDAFIWVANKKNYPNGIKAGHYKITQGTSNNDLINTLRNGLQTPIKVTFNNQDSLEKLAGRIAAQIEPDSLQVLAAITDSLFLNTIEFTKDEILGIFIPNSYEFYWNTSAENFRSRMYQEYQRFWTKNRLAKAQELRLSPKKIITLASIVQKETAKPSERPIVAGLYLNRLKRGWPLQADPTIIYALRKQHGEDFVVKRVLTKDLTIKSPYNTYTQRGLPPSLIAMPDISSIDAVLNAAKHNYLYMCASIENIGFHEFANSLSAHNRNAAKYQRWINSKGIQR
uniref:endolytic transglycosylase MltG n=1 Tax=Polaribacter sp. TaxID=1920175 RepID=UPI004047EC33